MSAERYQAGVVRERWDDTTRTYTAWNASGVQTTSRPYTAAENAQADAAVVALAAEANGVELRAKAQQALAVNDTFLALVTPTNAQVLTQVQRLTRENSALIRLVIGALESTNGT